MYYLTMYYVQFMYDFLVMYYFAKQKQCTVGGMYDLTKQNNE